MFPAQPLNQSIRILFVDDDPDIRYLMRRVLQREGFTTFIAENGSQALDLCQKHPVDLVILDVMMPAVNGYEICRQIRSSADIPVIFLTVLDEDADIVQGLEAGGYDYISKPFQLKELVARIYAALRFNLPQVTRPEKRFLNPGLQSSGL